MRTLVLFLIAVLAASGCTMVRYYKVSDLKAQFRKSETQAKKSVREAGKDLKLKRKKLKQLSETRGVDLKKPPYSELTGMTGKMSKELKKLKGHSARIGKLRKKMDKTVGKRKKIATNQPVYDKVESLIEEMKRYHEQATSTLNEYKALSTRFVERAKEIVK